MGKIRLTGATSGYTELKAAEAAGNNTITLPTTSGGEVIVSDSSGNVNIDSGTFYVDASNNRVGIGTSAPSAPCHVYSSTTQANDSTPALVVETQGHAQIRMNGDGNQWSLMALDSAVAGNNFIIYDKNTANERLRIDSSGRVGIGTSSPVALLQPNGTVSITGGSSASSANGLHLYFDTATNSGTITAFHSGVDNRNLTLDGKAIGFTIAGTEAMRINNGQELLVGYTTDNGAYKLQVNSQIFATSATIATSDGRYKENVATLEGCVDLVKALRPVSFDWKLQKDITRIDDEGNEIVVREGHNFPDGTQVGFIAQEVQEVLADKPWLGSIIKQNVRSAVTDNDGNELAPEEEFLGIAEGNLIAVLTSALQEAISEIESLKARVAALESA